MNPVCAGSLRVSLVSTFVRGFRSRTPSQRELRLLGSWTPPLGLLHPLWSNRPSGRRLSRVSLMSTCVRSLCPSTPSQRELRLPGPWTPPSGASPPPAIQPSLGTAILSRVFLEHVYSGLPPPSASLSKGAAKTNFWQPKIFARRNLGSPRLQSCCFSSLEPRSEVRCHSLYHDGLQ